MIAFLALGLCLLAEPIPKGEPEGAILLLKNSPLPVELILMKSTGIVVKRFEPKGIEGQVTSVRLNHTGTKAFLVCQLPIPAAAIPPPAAARIWPPMTGYVLDLDKPDEPAKPAFERLAMGSKVAWSPDGKSVYFSDLDVDALKPAKIGEPNPFRSWKLSLESGKKELLKLPVGHCIFDLSDDGKKLLTGRIPNVKKTDDYAAARAFLTPLDTLIPMLITDSAFIPSRVSPDGKRVIGFRYDEDTETSGQIRVKLLTVDATTKEETFVHEPIENKTVFTVPVWTNGGKRIAFMWYERIDRSGGGAINTPHNLTSTDHNGGAKKVIYKGELNESVMIFDWR